MSILIRRSFEDLLKHLARKDYILITGPRYPRMVNPEVCTGSKIQWCRLETNRAKTLPKKLSGGGVETDCL